MRCSKYNKAFQLGLVAMIGIAGCQTKMAFTDYEANQSTKATGKYSLRDIAVSGSWSKVSSESLKSEIAKKGLLTTADGDVLPVKIIVKASGSDANGGGAAVNNLFGICTLSIWPILSSYCFTYDLEIASVAGKQTAKVCITERDWKSLSPVGLLPVPGWADLRGETHQLNKFHEETIANKLVEMIALMTPAYEEFIKNNSKYTKLVSEESSRDALKEFFNAKSADEKLAWLNKVSDDKVIGESQKRIVAAYQSASEDAVKQALLLKLSPVSISSLDYSPLLVSRLEAVTNQTILAKLYAVNANESDNSVGEKILAKITDANVLTQMITPPSDTDNKHESRVKKEIQRIHERINDQKTELDRYSNKRHPSHYRGEIAECQRRIEKLKNELLIKEGELKENLYILDNFARTCVYKKVDANILGEIAEKSISNQTLDKWNQHDILAIETAAAIAASISNEDIAVSIIAHVAEVIDEYKAKCSGKWTLMSWDSRDEAQAKRLIGCFDKVLTPSIREKVLLQNKKGWSYVLDGVSPDSALKLISSKTLKYVQLEVELAKLVNAEQITLELYKGARSDALRKVLMERMPDHVKTSVLEEAKKKIDELLAKAENQKGTTFVLAGFYIGMSASDAEVLIRNYLPKSTITRKDGFIDIDITDNSQHKMYFCDIENGKVVRINFDKKLLSKWLNYDVQTYREWIQAFVNAHDGIRFVGKHVRGKKEYETAFVSVSQEAYHYKSNSQGFSLTYFGDKDVTDFSNNLHSSNVDVSNPFAAFGAGMQEGIKVGLRNWPNSGWENGDGAKEGTLRVEKLKED